MDGLALYPAQPLRESGGAVCFSPICVPLLASTPQTPRYAAPRISACTMPVFKEAISALTSSGLNVSSARKL